jgi:hypothetical protein
VRTFAYVLIHLRIQTLKKYKVFTPVKIQTIESSGPWQRAVSRLLAVCGTSCGMHIYVRMYIVCVCVYMRQEGTYM